MSHIFPENWVKSAYFLGFEHFSRKKLKKIAIFCTTYFRPYVPICPMILPKIAQNLGFSAFFPKKVQFFAIFVQNHLDLCGRSARPAALVAATFIF